MRKTIVVLAIPIAFAAACSRSRIDRDQRQYEVVQEGAANGVTSTLGGPGETPPLTGTNADTTSAFTLDPRLSTAAPMQQPSVADGMPQQGSVPSYGTPPSAMQSRPVTQSAPRQTADSEPTYRPPVSSAPRSTEQAPPTYPTPTAQQPAPPATDTQPAAPAVDTAAPPTDTVDPATAPPPSEKPKKPKKDKPADPPPPTDTSTTEPAPPPPATDTAPRG